MAEEQTVYIVPETTTLTTPETKVKLIEEIRTKKKLPTLREVIASLKKDLEEAGLKEWEASIEAHITIGTGSVIPGGEAGIKTTLTFSSGDSD